MTRKKRPYMQFSKKIVVAVTAFVSIICMVTVVLMFIVRQAQYMSDIVKSYIGFSMLVFATYSGNSIAEKFILHGNFGKIMSFKSTDSEEDQNETEG